MPFFQQNIPLVLILYLILNIVITLRALEFFYHQVEIYLNIFNNCCWFSFVGIAVNAQLLLFLFYFPFVC